MINNTHRQSTQKRAAKLLVVFLASTTSLHATEFVGKIVDSSSQEPISARIYLQDDQDKWIYVESADPRGTALPYREQWVPMPGSIEKHTTVSAHPFKVELKPGSYTLTIERGKEYLPARFQLDVTGARQERTFPLQRFADYGAQGWYSGETHVHRRISELPNVMLAEDLNVAFPVTFWTTESDRAPDLSPSLLRRQGPSPFGDRVDHGPHPIRIDPTHVILPRNTEYEIFSVGKKPHVLGAVFILNHQTRFDQTMPPVAEIAKQAHQEGALLDLDKHSWPWALMLVPVANIDLFELSNNSVWRTQFGFRTASVSPPEYMKIEMHEGGMTEWGWIRYGLETYYALLNCGFPLKPTAGTASGVHPVPLGYSRVYVHIEGAFSVDKWLEGLKRGRSFVTNGPLLDAKLNGQYPGSTFVSDDEMTLELDGSAAYGQAIDRFEWIVNGEVVSTFQPPRTNQSKRPPFLYEMQNQTIKIQSSGWVALRAIHQSETGRVQFAHTAPWFVEIKGSKLLPTREQIEFLVHRMKQELVRNQDVLDEESLDEFRTALTVYETLRTQLESAQIPSAQHD
jgi:hypothetical protein